jgi:hypothetical protein
MPPDSAKLEFAELLYALEFDGAEFPSVDGNFANYTPALILIKENKTLTVPISPLFAKTFKISVWILLNAQWVSNYNLDQENNFRIIWFFVIFWPTCLSF